MPQEINQPQQEYSNSPQNNGIDWAGDIQRFFKNDLKDMFLAVIRHPATGAQKWLGQTKSQSIVMPICMTVLSFLVVALLSFIIAEIRIPSFYMKFMGLKFGTFVALGLMPVFFACFVAGLMFALFAIKKRPDIFLAIRHAGVHVFVFTLACLAILVTVLVFGASKLGLLIVALVVICAISMGFSIARTAIKSMEPEGKECFSWYLSPLVVIISLWLSYLIVSAFMPPSLLSVLL